MFEQEPKAVLQSLFNKAKATDEFEFCLSLLRVHYFTDHPANEPRLESFELINQFLPFIAAPLDGKLKTRLLLFLYCHVTEIDYLYEMIANLARICNGERYSGDPFRDDLHSSKKDAKTPRKRIERIKEWLGRAGITNIGVMLEEMLIDQVRNAFYHSDYFLFDNNFIIFHGKGVNIDNKITTRVPMDWLLPRIQLAINFVLAMYNLIQLHINSYTQQKIVPARILENDKVDYLMLMVHPHGGLRGFRGLTDEEKKQHLSSG